LRECQPTEKVAEEIKEIEAIIEEAKAEMAKAAEQPGSLKYNMSYPPDCPAEVQQICFKHTDPLECINELVFMCQNKDK
jgi:hypothetical protein